MDSWCVLCQDSGQRVGTFDTENQLKIGILWAPNVEFESRCKPVLFEAQEWM